MYTGERWSLFKLTEAPGRGGYQRVLWPAQWCTRPVPAPTGVQEKGSLCTGTARCVCSTHIRNGAGGRAEVGTVS